MLVNKINHLIKRDNNFKPFSKSHQYALTRNRFEINLLNNNLKKIENEFDKKNAQLRHSLVYTVQSFQLIKDSTGNTVRMIQNSRDLETNYQSELEKFHKENLESVQQTDDPKSLRITQRTKKYRSKYSKMKPILSDDEIKKYKLEKCDLNLNDWIKYKQNQYDQSLDINLKKFCFSDRNLYEAYLDVIEERDAYMKMKSLSQKRTHLSDEIYLKQHRRLMKARATNTTPTFEINQNYTNKYSRPLLNKLKQNLINEFNLKPFSNGIKFKSNHELNEKVKKFLN